MNAEPKPVAAVITEWRENSHADVLLARILEPEAWGHTKPFALRLASIYADQFPEKDLCRHYAEKHGVPIFDTITGAVGVGTRSVPVEGVILVGEHGSYPHNARRQHMYPRRRLLEGVVHAFRVLGRRVPLFSDKHLSYEWLNARWMYDLARHEGIPFMAGSSLPVAWRVPELALPIGSPLESAFALAYGDLDAYGFHGLETLQCMTERRKGGETGVATVRCLTGNAIWEAAQAGAWPKPLLDALLPVRRQVKPTAEPVQPRPNDALFLIRYVDGLQATAGMFNSVGECFGFSGQIQGDSEPKTTVFALEGGRPYGHFGHLLRAIEKMVLTGRPSYPVERTLLTTGILAALLQSRAEGGREIRTPHLAAIQYEPADWPFAPGPSGTAA
jgi:hypothetical protein